MKTIRKRNIWVLGGTGYIGSALVNFLSRDPENNLHLLLHKNTPYRFLERFNTFSGSIGRFDTKWFERYPPDVIFHLARPAGSTFFSRLWRANQGGKANRRLMKVVSSLENKPIVVYVSGSLMYGKLTVENPALEDSPLNPYSFANHYISNENPWLEAQQSGLLDVRFARPGWIVGPGSWFNHFFWNHYVLTGNVPCYGDHPMSLIHVDDCALLIDALARYGQKGQNLNVFAGPAINHRKFCEILAEILHAPVQDIPYELTKKQFGNITAKALVSSTPMQTLYPDLYKKVKLKYEDPEKLLQFVLGQLKNV